MHARHLAVCLTLLGLPVPALARDEAASALVFASLDAGEASFASGGFKYAFERLDQTGFVLLASVGGGRRGERVACDCAASGQVTRYARLTVFGAAVAGYQWVSGWGVLALHVGPEAAAEGVYDQGTLTITPPRFGLRLHGEAWVRPAEDWLVQGTLVLGSARGDVYGRLATGYRLWETYLGPEAALYADADGYRKWSLGLHGTDFALGRYSFRASAGLQWEERERRTGPYVALAIWTPL